MFIRLRERIKPIIVDKFSRRLLLVGIFFNLSSWGLLLISLFPSIRRGEIIALHYNVYLNVNQIGNAYLALLPAAIGTAIIIINTYFAVRSYTSNRSNSIVFLAVTVFYEILLFASAIFIFLINRPR